VRYVVGVLITETHGMRLVLTIRGKKHALWRALNQEGNMLGLRFAAFAHYIGSQTIFPAALLKKWEEVPP
jgi:hypothetical protein